MEIKVKRHILSGYLLNIEFCLLFFVFAPTEGTQEALCSLVLQNLGGRTHVKACDQIQYLMAASATNYRKNLAAQPDKRNTDSFSIRHEYWVTTTSIQTTLHIASSP